MKKLIIGLMALGLTNLCFSQVDSNGIAEVELEGVVITAPNYDYLNEVLDKDASEKVKDLQMEVATFNIKNLENYNPEVEEYQVIFNRSNGKVIAVYDKNGDIESSFERYRNVIVPRRVLTKIYMDHYGWELIKDTYQVSYKKDKDVKKVYKVHLLKGDLKKSLKLDHEGQFVSN